MYSRQPTGAEGPTYTFEPSGGLLNASLVMRDRETDSWWSIINDTAIHGVAKGAPLVQVPGAEKATWGDWKQRHPHTKVLSVEGKEHEERSPYDGYFASEKGFRETTTSDDRLSDKQLLYAFHWQDRAYAVPFPRFESSGASVALGARQLFLYRQPEDSSYRSTVAYLAPEGTHFERDEAGAWLLTHGETTYRFDPRSRRFAPKSGVEAFHGFDTYWYVWSLTNPSSEIIEDRKSVV